MFQFYLSHLHRIPPGASEAEWDHGYQTLSSMHFAMGISFERGKPASVRFWDCGYRQASFCLLPEREPAFEYTDDRFLKACGVKPAPILGAQRPFRALLTR